MVDMEVEKPTFVLKEWNATFQERTMDNQTMWWDQRNIFKKNQQKPGNI